MLAYHDEEWGVPSHDDRHLFELLTLEGAQAGLSWNTILNKREGYREAFAGFDPEAVARFGPKEIERLVADPGIVRNRLKIESTVNNAARVLEVQEELGSFDAYLWRFVDGEPIVGRWRDSDRASRGDGRLVAPFSKDLKRRGFRFVGPTICYAFMQAVGMVNDHTIDCFRFRAARTMTAPIRYARSGDVNIAYQVTGEGPFDLVLVPGFFSHLEIDWEHPAHAHFLERLGSFARLIRFDKRGTGLSDRDGRPPRLRDADGRRARRHGRSGERGRPRSSATRRAGRCASSSPPRTRERTRALRPVRDVREAVATPMTTTRGRRPWEERGRVRPRARGDVGRERRPLDDVAERRRGEMRVVPAAWPRVPEPGRGARPHPHELEGRRA